MKAEHTLTDAQLALWKPSIRQLMLSSLSENKAFSNWCSAHVKKTQHTPADAQLTL